jgi:energy-coupling factor transporter ATP-binding protein EcfA2
VTVTPFGDEPSAAPWSVCRLGDLLTDLRTAIGPVAGRPVIVAVDGRQGGGKSTLARWVAGLVPGTAIVHTDDLAWWESFFDWDHLMAAGVLEPLRQGQDVTFRPPAWDARGRDGSIEVAAAAPLVIVEGVGSSRVALTGMLDAAVWVQSDAAEATRRGIHRDGGTPTEAAFWHEWAAEENPFLAQDRPWERAAAVVCGTPDLAGLAYDPISDALRGRSLRI